MRSATVRMGLFVVGGSQIGSPILEVQPTLLLSDLERASRIVAAEETREISARRKTGLNVLTLLQPHASGNPDVAALAGMLDLSLEQQLFQNQTFLQILDQLEQAGAEAVSTDYWNQFQIELNDRINHLLRGFQTGELDAKGAGRLLGVARYAKRAIKDLKDFDPFNPHSSRLFHMLNLLQGIAAGVTGVGDPSAKDVLEEFRHTLAEISESVQGVDLKYVQTFEIPVAVNAGRRDQTSRGWEAAYELVQNFYDALDGHPEALPRMLESARQLDEVLSSRAYARAIWNALTDRLIDHIPIARTLANWFGDELSANQSG